MITGQRRIAIEPRVESMIMLLILLMPVLTVDIYEKSPCMRLPHAGPCH